MKILEISKTAVLKKLRDIRAKLIYTGSMKVRYFDFPDGRIRKKGDLLRLREIVKGDGIHTEFVYKKKRGIKGGCKVFDETEMTFDGAGVFESMSAVFKKMGLKQTVYYEKRRTLYAYKKWKFEIDEYPRIPPLVEVEAADPRTVKEGISLLGLDGYEKSSETIDELARRKYKLKLNDLIFNKKT